MTNYATHIIQNFESSNKSVLSRKRDGLVLAVRSAQTVAWGEDPRQQQQRVFIDPKFAQAFLRKIADADREATDGCACKCHNEHGFPPCLQCNDQHQQALTARIEEIEGESRVVSPSLRGGLQ